MWAVKWWSKSWSHLRDHSDLEWGEVNGWKNGGFVWTLCWTSVWKFSSALQATILDITNFTGSSTSSLYRESCYIRTCWSLWRLHQGVESIVRYILNSFLPEFAFFFCFKTYCRVSKSQAGLAQSTHLALLNNAKSCEHFDGATRVNKLRGKIKKWHSKEHTSTERLKEHCKNQRYSSRTLAVCEDINSTVSRAF